ncbi:cytochrome P450 [Macroventuria anomochaeta]|uniref:Cytochrome P450 n=1 Tax=Macroventuria anomochaeta TaxID=301207 RepID=A0ACB6RSQ7_9PLEO|nr:cytochrome P450 [Macroventuria anomochaeta]KAF2624737.1 cytochrome P450 [Macroventuria anomochaeta]
MPFLGVLTAAPTYIRFLIKIGALSVPKLLKSILAADGIRKLAVREIYKAHQWLEVDTDQRPDMTSKLMSVVRGKGTENNLGLKEVVIENFTGVMAGADSTSMELCSIFYYLMKHPDKLAKLKFEVDATYAHGSVTSPARYNQVVTPEYFMAVVKDSFRLFPPLVTPIQRHSPPQGIVTAGSFIPGGWSVGLIPGVVQYNKDVF